MRYMRKNVAFRLWLVLILAGGLVAVYGCGGSQLSNGDVSAPADAPAALVTDSPQGGRAPDIALIDTEPPLAVIDDSPSSDAGREAMTPWPSPVSGGWSTDTHQNYSTASAFDGNYSTWWVGKTTLDEWDVFYGFSEDRDVTRVSVNFYSTSYIPATATQICFSDDGISWFATATMDTTSASDTFYATTTVSAKYIWLHMAGKPAVGYPIIRDIDWEPVRENAAAYARPGYNHAYYFPSKMFDGSDSTVWTGAVGAGEWNVYYHFNASTTVKMVNASMFNDANHPAVMTLFTSGDGLSWTEIGEMESASNTTQYVGADTAYLRIQMQDTGGTYYPYIKEITWDSMPAGGSSGDSLNPTYIGANAFDNKINTWWAGDSTQTSWDLFYNFTTPTAVDSLMIYHYADTYVPATTTVYCSSDAITWTQKDQVTSGHCPVLNVSDTCTYMRLHMEGAPTSGYPIIKDIDWGEWIPLGEGCAAGDGLSEGATAYFSKLSMDPGNVVYAAYSTDESTNGINVKKWLCPNWVSLGSGITGSSSGYRYDLAIDVDSQDRPFVAWGGNVESGTLDYEIYGKRWNGSAWEELDGSATDGGISQTDHVEALNIDVQINEDDDIYASWIDIDRSGLGIHVYLRYFDGSTWNELGNSATGTGLSGLPDGEARLQSMALIENVSGTFPVIAWEESLPPLGTHHIYLKKWNGTSWVELDGSATGTGVFEPVSGQPSVAVDSAGDIYVTYSHLQDGNYEIFINHWNGSSWSSPTNISNNVGNSGASDIYIDENGTIFVAWTDDHDGDTNHDIYLRKYNGSNWVEVGTWSATHNGISMGDDEDSIGPSVVVSSSGRPAVSWADVASDTIFVKQFIE